MSLECLFGHFDAHQDPLKPKFQFFSESKLFLILSNSEIYKYTRIV